MKKYVVIKADHYNCTMDLGGVYNSLADAQKAMIKLAGEDFIRYAKGEKHISTAKKAEDLLIDLMKNDAFFIGTDNTSCIYYDTDAGVDIQIEIYAV